MFSLLLHDIRDSDRDLAIADLWARGSGGMVERENDLEAFFEDDANRTALAEAFRRWSPLFLDHATTDWVGATQRSFPPQMIGERFFLAPPWNTDETPAGRLRLEINPGLACGTGWHPCTRMCLQALERMVRPGDRVFDVGTGSGILSVAARLLGAGFVAGCDIDDEAVCIARERVQNPLFVGSTDAVISHSFDLLVSNISAEVTRDLFSDFERIARRLVLSGFEHAPDLPRPPSARLESDGWECLIYYGWECLIY